MATKVYGHSDDCIEIDGDVHGECYLGKSGRSRLIFDDGTELKISYGLGGGATWDIVLLKAGPLFDRIDKCPDPTGDTVYTDTAHFRDGLKSGRCGGKAIR